MNISLPDSLKAFVEEQVAEKGYGTSTETVAMGSVLRGVLPHPTASRCDRVWLYRLIACGCTG
jgi:hypothetical protein